MDPPKASDPPSAPHIPIAALDPSEHPPQDQCIHGIVSLVWPYSSSTRTAALLLVEPDFRLRRRKGQVRVQLVGAAARAVAEAHVGIGDSVDLYLVGASWTEGNDNVKTPGRSVDGELRYRRRIALDVRRDGAPFATVDVSAPESPATSTPAEAATPAPARRQDIDQTPARASIGESFDSPFKLSIGTESGVLGLFSDNWDLEGRPKKRLRTSGFWRYKRTSGSPEEATIRVGDEDHSRDPALVEAGAMSRDEILGDVDKESRPMANPEAPAVASIFPSELQRSPQSQTSERQLISDLPHIQTDIQPEGLFAVPLSLLPQTPSEPRLDPVQSAALPAVSPIAPWATPSIQTSSAEFKNFFDLLGYGPADGAFAGDEQSQEAMLSLSTRATDETKLHEQAPAFVLEDEPVLSQETEDILGLLNVLDEPSVSGPTALETRSGDEAVGFEGLGQAESLAGQSIRLVRDTYELAGEEEVCEDLEALDPQQTVEHPLKWPSMSQQSLPAEGKQSFTTVDISDDDARAPEIRETAGSDDAMPISTFSLDLKKEPSGLVVVREPTNEEDAQSVSHFAPETSSDRGTKDPLSLIFQQPTPEASQEKVSQPFYPSLPGHRVDQILDGRFPPTPVTSSIPPEMAETELPEHHKEAEATLHEPHRATDADLHSEVSIKPSTENIDQQPETPKQSMGPPKQISGVPNVLSAWFTSGRNSAHRLSPFRSKTASRARAREGSLTPTASMRSTPNVGFDFTAAQENTSFQSPQQASPQQASPQHASPIVKGQPTEGLRTKHSYYTPLSSLTQHLNTASQYTTMGIDIIAVVTSPTSVPARAKGGPRDFSTLLHITDKSDWSEKIQVQVFRPFKTSLPVASVGDVIILRSFLVKSRLRQCFLLSGEASGWHVWRFSQLKQQGSEVAPGSKQSKNDDPNGLQEECCGPPVEVGAEERRHAFALREWWLALQRGLQSEEGDEPDGDTNHEETSANGVLGMESTLNGVHAVPRHVLATSR